MEEIVLFVHRPGVQEPVEITIATAATVTDLLSHPAVVAVVAELSAGGRDVFVFVEEFEEPLPPVGPIGDHGVHHGHRIHLGHLRKVEVEIYFTHRVALHDFPPGTRVRRVKEWAAKHFGLAGNDAIEHVLNLHGTAETPSPGAPLSTLLRHHHHHHHHKLAFDLVPAKRVEG